MAESGLTLAWTELQQEVGFFLSHGRTIANFSAATAAEVAAVVQSGVRRVYYPIGLPQELSGYEWSWLRPTATLYLGASGTDGSIVTDAFDSATFTDWVAQGVTSADTVNITAVGAGTTTVADYAISSVLAGAITLTSLTAGDGTDLTFLVHRDPCNYTLPDDFGRLAGSLHYEADENRIKIDIIPLSDLLELRSRSNETDAPRYAAIRPRASDGSAGQKQEILFWPKTSAYYALSYSYEAYQGALADANPYPLGGMQMSELYLESCLSVAEQRMNDEAGLHTQLYQALLLDAVSRDMKKGAHSYGQMGHREHDEYGQGRRPRGYTGGTYQITYNGNLL